MQWMTHKVVEEEPRSYIRGLAKLWSDLQANDVRLAN